MKYVYDTSSLTIIFRHYYQEAFPSFWEKFDQLLENNLICSVREVAFEIRDLKRGDVLEKWSKSNKLFFENPNTSELEFIKKIYGVSHFQQNLNKKKLLKGGPFADPFLISKAFIYECCVVTQEEFKPNAASIANICRYFKIPYLNVEGFLKQENWKF